MWPSLAKMVSVCRLCGSSVAYSHHRVALFRQKANQERLAIRISALLNDDDGLLKLRCAKCKRRVESLEMAMMMDLTKFKRSVAVLGSEHSLHAIVLSWQVYYIESKLWRQITQKNQKIARSPHILGRLNACTNSVYQALLHFSRTPGARLSAEQHRYALPRLSEIHRKSPKYGRLYNPDTQWWSHDVCNRGVTLYLYNIIIL